VEAVPVLSAAEGAREATAQAAMALARVAAAAATEVVARTAAAVQVPTTRHPAKAAEPLAPVLVARTPAQSMPHPAEGAPKALTRP
jgi:hypothetical protein